MVYCGKPSRGCQMCRTRRIKCDETKPTCNQCAKSRRQCPGYKDEFDLVFRNETKATERRARKANNKALAHKSSQAAAGPIVFTFDTSQPGASTSTITPAFEQPLAITALPGFDTQQQAHCHFLANFVVNNGDRSYCDFVVPLLSKANPAPHLQHAFLAASLSLLNNRRLTNQTLRNRALYEYTKALHGTNNALRNPATQGEDSTLAAVLLLGLYEHITAKQIGSLAWGQHVDGAVQLVRARGKKQVKTATGKALFSQVRTQMISNCILSGKQPNGSPSWWFDGVDNDMVSDQAHRLLMRLSDIRYESTKQLESHTANPTPNSQEILGQLILKAQEIDRGLGTWLATLPEAWQPRTIAWEDSVPNNDYFNAEVFPGPVHVYSDIFASGTINRARSGRLVLASIIVRLATWVNKPADYRLMPEYATASHTCSVTIRDTISSIPFHMGWHLKRRHLLQRINLDQFACGTEESPKSLSGYSLTSALAFMVGIDFLSDTQRAYVCGRLKHIGDEFGVRYAHILRHLQVRIPSMLIRRDGLSASPYGKRHDFMAMVSVKTNVTESAASPPREKVNDDDDDDD